MVLQGLVKFSRFSVQRCYTAERFGFDGSVLVLVGLGDRPSELLERDLALF